MANWSDLPPELLYSISLLLTTSIDILRFRSVCTTWRRAVAQPRPAASGNLPSPISTIFGKSLNIAKRTIYALQLPVDNNKNDYYPSSSWIIKFELDNISHSMLHLHHPLTLQCFKTCLPHNFPKPFSFLNLRVTELGEEYTASPSHCIDNSYYIKKVAVLKDNNNNTFVMLLSNLSTYLLSKSGDNDDQEWMLIRDFATDCCDDVIVIGGKFYVFDGYRTLARVNHIDLRLEIIVDSPDDGLGKKYLVDCQGNLLLVEHESHECYYYNGEVTSDFHQNRVEKVQVFKMDENSGKWIEVNDVGDMILFLGESRSFSASAKDVFGGQTSTCCKGNCIVYWNEELGCVGVFDLETQSSKDLDYSNMFWPPPHWACNSPANN